MKFYKRHYKVESRLQDDWSESDRIILKHDVKMHNIKSASDCYVCSAQIHEWHLYMKSKQVLTSLRTFILIFIIISTWQKKWLDLQSLLIIVAIYFLIISNCYKYDKILDKSRYFLFINKSCLFSFHCITTLACTSFYG